MIAVTLTTNDKIGSERLGDWLEVTELLNGRVGILTQGSGLVPALLSGQISGSGLTTMVLGKHTHLIHRKSLNTFFVCLFCTRHFRNTKRNHYIADKVMG